MMMADRLVHLIENHSEALAACLLRRVQNSDATPGYKHVPSEELKDRVYEIYRDLGDWLMTKDELELKLRYSEIGARRAQQHVPLSQLVWAMVLTKENLWEYIKKESVLGRPGEVFGELEMLQLLDRFFDSAYRKVHATCPPVADLVLAARGLLVSSSFLQGSAQDHLVVEKQRMPGAHASHVRWDRVRGNPKGRLGIFGWVRV